MKKSIKAFYILAIFGVSYFSQACHSPKTPDYSKTENEGSNPEGNRSSDSTMYDPVTEDGASGTNQRNTAPSQVADDSLSGGRR